MKTLALAGAPDHPADFTLAVNVGTGETYEWSKVLLAKATYTGTLELLTAAWERLLGYGREEFAGKTLRHLLRSNEAAAARAVAAILDEGNMEPIEITVRCRRGEAKRLRLHRRFDAYSRKMYILAEEASTSELTARMAG